MGQPERAKNMVRNLLLDDKQVEALEDNDEAKWLAIGCKNILTKCGNCGKRHKCATDQMSSLRERTNIDKLLKQIELDDKSNTELANLGLRMFEFFDEKLDEDDWIELSGILISEFDIDPIDIVESIDEMFSECKEYNLKEEIFKKM